MHMFIDYDSLWEIAKSRHAEDLRAAAHARRAEELPQQPSVLRASVSRWLLTLAFRIEPGIAPPMAGSEPAAAHAR